MALTKISNEVIEQNLENYLKKSLKAGSALSDLEITTYADAAGVNPVDGLGGSPGISVSLNTSSPLSGDADLRIVKDASNRQGNGISIPFTIENRHLAKVLQITFDTELISGNYESPIIISTTGTYSITSTTCTVTAPHSFIAGQVVNMTFTSGTVPPNGTYVITSVTATTFVFTVASGSGTGNCSYTVPADLRVSIIQDPTGTPVVIEPVNTGIQLGIANQRIRHIASFQTHLSITSYRLCIHVANASTVAYTVDFANFKVWEPTQSVGAVITDWQSYTPTGSWITNATYTGRWRRIGGNLEVRGRVSLTGTTTTSSLTINLPSRLSIDSSNLPTGNSIIGEAHGVTGSGSNTVVAGVFVAGTSSVYFTWIISNGASPNPASPNPAGYGVLSNTSPLTFGNGDYVAFKYSVPIQGWGSSVVMSSDSGDGRVVALVARGFTAPTVDTATAFTTIKDTHGSYSSGVYTIPVPGDYRVSVSYIFPVSSSAHACYVSVNNATSGTNRYDLGYSASTNVSSGGACIIPNLRAGDTLSIRANATAFQSSSQSILSIERISAGSQIIAATETVACSYWLTSNTASNTDPIPFGGVTGTIGRIYDTHSSMINGTFTAPMNGIYLMTGHIPTGTTGSWVEVWINGIQNRRRFLIDSDSYVKNVYIQLRLLAGQTLQLRPFTTFTISGGTLDSGGTAQIEISRIGI